MRNCVHLIDSLSHGGKFSEPHDNHSEHSLDKDINLLDQLGFGPSVREQAVNENEKLAAQVLSGIECRETTELRSGQLLNLLVMPFKVLDLKFVVVTNSDFLLPAVALGFRAEGLDSCNAVLEVPLLGPPVVVNQHLVAVDLEHLREQVGMRGVSCVNVDTGLDEGHKVVLAEELALLVESHLVH